MLSNNINEKIEVFFKKFESISDRLRIAMDDIVSFKKDLVQISSSLGNQNILNKNQSIYTCLSNIRSVDNLDINEELFAKPNLLNLNDIDVLNQDQSTFNNYKPLNPYLDNDDIVESNKFSSSPIQANNYSLSQSNNLLKKTSNQSKQSQSQININKTYKKDNIFGDQCQSNRNNNNSLKKNKECNNKNTNLINDNLNHNHNENSSRKLSDEKSIILQETKKKEDIKSVSDYDHKMNEEENNFAITIKSPIDIKKQGSKSEISQSSLIKNSLIGLYNSATNTVAVNKEVSDFEESKKNTMDDPNNTKKDDQPKISGLKKISLKNIQNTLKDRVSTKIVTTEKKKSNVSALYDKIYGIKHKILKDKIKNQMSKIKINLNKNDKNDNNTIGTTNPKKESDSNHLNAAIGNKSMGFNNSSVNNFDDDDAKFKQLLFEMNSYPKALVMIDENKQILFYNQNFSLQLLYDRSELITSDMSFILNNQDPTVNYDLLIDDIIGQLIYQRMTPIEVGEHILSFQDKENNLVQFVCKFNFHTIDLETEDLNQIIIQMDQDMRDESNQCSFDPKNGWYLLFSLLIGLNLMFLIFQVPQDIAFGDETMAQFNFIMDMIITAVFTVDIILNFFAAYEDDLGKQVYNSKKIIFAQLSTSFILDVMATIPFEYLFGFIAFNTNILKSVRILKIAKLIKILRVSKYISFISQKSSFIEREVGQETWMMLKRSSGFFELMMQNLQILIGAHYYTIVFYQVKNGIIEDNNTAWISEYFGGINTNQLRTFNIYLFLISEMVKTALGLSVIRPTNEIEIVMNLAWMFIGLSMFGQGIGNISSYLNNIQQEELEHMNALVQFRELCENNELDHRIYNIISSEVDSYQKSMGEKKFQLKGKILSKQTMIQLETALQKDQISKFNLFSLLNIATIRQIKNNSKIIHETFKQGMGSVINEVIVILKGKLTVQNDSLSFLNEQNVHEIFGMELFKTFCHTKQKIDFDQIYEQSKSSKMEYEKSKNMENQIEKISSVKEQISKKIKSKPTKSMPVDDYTPTLVEEDSVKVTIQNSIVASNDIIQVSLPFKVLEEIFFNDIESFFTIWRYNSKQVEVISEIDRKNAQDAIKEFNESIQPALMLTDTGEVQDINLALYGIEEVEFSQMLGRNFFDFVLTRDTADFENIQYLMNRNELNELELNLEGIKCTMNIEKSVYNKIVRGENNKDGDQHFYNLKKSMIGVKTIQFDIKFGD